MNRLLRAVVLTFGLAAAVASAQPGTNDFRDQLVLRNGDAMFGQLLAVTPNQILQWRHPDASEPMNFILDTVVEVELGSLPRPAPEYGGCKVLFANGDRLQGRLLECDADTVTVDVPSAGRLKLPRHRVQTITMLSGEPPIIDGITSLDGWTEVSSPITPGADAGHWTYRNGAFYASKPASVARDLKLPNKARIEFDLAWRGPPNLAIAFFTDSLRPILLVNKEAGPDFGGFYSFRLGGIVAEMYPIKKHGQSVSLGSVILAALGRSDHAHFDFRFSKPQNRIALLVDGVLVMQWNDPNGFEGEGTGIRFVENSGAIKVSNLRVTHWNGSMEEGPDNTPNLTQDQIWLDSGQAIAGTVAALTEQTLTLRIQGGSQQIPMATVRRIAFAAPPTRPLETAGGVRAMFAQGGSIRGQLESWGPDGAIIRSPNFGRAKFAPNAFVSLQFQRDEAN